MPEKPSLTSLRIQKPSGSNSPAPKPAVHNRQKTESRKQKLFKLTRQANKQLVMLKAETERTEQDLLTEAVNLLFTQYGKPPIA